MLEIILVQGFCPLKLLPEQVDCFPGDVRNSCH